ncbi:cytochrome P450 [Mycena maculata]|uniref:Cytochrome P450 n=1 Tax=Mycena maculata TaxID=230809 RepID=A0AAD7N8Q7_9AGAR|nr:cytochrome P450 [Mycena maculata]
MSSTQKLLGSTSALTLVLALTNKVPVDCPVSFDLSAFAPTWLPQSILARLQNPDFDALVAIGSVGGLLTALALYLHRRSRFPPLVPYTNPVYGSTREYAEKPKEFLNAAFDKYGPVFRANILGRDQVILDHDYAQLLFTLLGKGLDHEQGVIDLQYFDVIIKLGSQHHLHDSGKMILKYLNPASPSYETYGPIVQLVYQKAFKEALEKMNEKNSIDVEDPFDLCKKCLADAMASVIVGVDLANDKDITWVFINVSEVVAEMGGLEGHGSLASILPFYGRLHAYYVMKVRQVMKPYKTVLRAKVGAEINRRMALRQTVTEQQWKEIRPHDVLQGLLEEHGFGSGAIKVDDFMGKIENMLLFVIFAAIHGTAVALSWVLYLVATDSAYQKQIYDELTDLVNGTDDASGLTPSVLKSAKYLDSFTREVLRWRPDCLSPTPRKAMKDLTLPNGYIIPKGMLVTHVFYRTHVNNEKQNCEDSKEFRPWRHVGKPAATSVNVSNSFLTFGVGKTACPGRYLATYEIKLFIALLVSRYKMSLPKGITVDQPGFTFQAPPSGTITFKQRALEDILL